MTNRSPLVSNVLGLVAVYIFLKVLFGPPGSIVPPWVSGSLAMLLPFIGIGAVLFGLSRRRGGSP